MSYIIESPFPSFNDTDGSPLNNGYVYVGSANLNPVTDPIPVYWDAALTQPAAQPIRTINGYLSRNGSPGRIYTNFITYSFRVTNNKGEQVFSDLNYTDPTSSAGSTYQQVITAIAGQTVFNLSRTYIPGTNNLFVYRNGLRLIVGQDYNETGYSQVTLTAGAANGDEFVFDIGYNYDSAASVDAQDVTYKLPAVDSVFTNVEAKLSEIISVKDFGAVGDGITDDTAAFSAACAAAPTTDCISNNWNILFPQRANIYVPAGSYLLNSLIDTSGKEVVWHCNHGAEFLPLPQTGLSRLNGRLVRDGIHFSSYHFGIKDPATTLSIKGNPKEWHDEGAYVNAFSEPYQLADIAPRDCCSLVVDNRNISATSNISSANYTATTFIPSTPLSSDTVKKLRVGMVIDTKHTPNKYSGFITAWALDGTNITVSGWFATGNTSAGQVPSSGTGAYINQFTKIFANNSLVWLEEDPSNTGKAKECAGFELDIHNNKGTPGGADVNYAWGFDCVSAGAYPATAAYLTRGGFNIAFHSYGTAGSGPYLGDQTTGFQYDGNQNGFVFQNRTTGNGVPIIVKDATLGYTATLYPNGDMRCLNTARAWVNFNGNLSSPIAPRNGFNVSSITKTGTGQYTVNFIVPMLNTNYCTLGSFNDLGAGATTFATTAWNLNSVSIALSRPGVGFYDHGVVNVAVFNNNY